MEHEPSIASNVRNSAPLIIECLIEPFTPIDALTPQLESIVQDNADFKFFIF